MINNEDRTIKKVIITGITGSGGSYLAEHIVENHPEVEVNGTSRWHSTSSAKNLEKIIDKVHVHECDLCDMGATIRVIEKVDPDAIFHLAAYANVRAAWDNPVAVLDNNIRSTANLFEALRILKKKPIVQLCSTSEVYGQVDPKNVPITEECPINPINPYAVSKLTQDALGYTYFKGFDIPVVRTRMFAYINPKRADLFATSFALQVAKIEKGLQKTLKHGNLDSKRTLIDVRDAMVSYWYATKYGKIGEVYNIGGNTIITVGEFLDELKKYASCEIPSEIDKNLLRPVDVTLQIPDVSKFKRDTNWEPKYSFQETVKFLLDYCRDTINQSK